MSGWKRSLDTPAYSTENFEDTQALEGKDSSKVSFNETSQSQEKVGILEVTWKWLDKLRKNVSEEEKHEITAITDIAQNWVDISKEKLEEKKQELTEKFKWNLNFIEEFLFDFVQKPKDENPSFVDKILLSVAEFFLGGKYKKFKSDLASVWKPSFELGTDKNETKKEKTKPKSQPKPESELEPQPQPQPKPKEPKEVINISRKKKIYYKIWWNMLVSLDIGKEVPEASDVTEALYFLAQKKSSSSGLPFSIHSLGEYVWKWEEIKNKIINDFDIPKNTNEKVLNTLVWVIESLRSSTTETVLKNTITKESLEKLMEREKDLWRYFSDSKEKWERKINLLINDMRSLWVDFSIEEVLILYSKLTPSMHALKWASLFLEFASYSEEDISMLWFDSEYLKNLQNLGSEWTLISKDIIFVFEEEFGENASIKNLWWLSLLWKNKNDEVVEKILEGLKSKNKPQSYLDEQGLILNSLISFKDSFIDEWGVLYNKKLWLNDEQRKIILGNLNYRRIILIYELMWWEAKVTSANLPVLVLNIGLIMWEWAWYNNSFEGWSYTTNYIKQIFSEDNDLWLTIEERKMLKIYWGKLCDLFLSQTIKKWLYIVWAINPFDTTALWFITWTVAMFWVSFMNKTVENMLKKHKLSNLVFSLRWAFRIATVVWILMLSKEVWIPALVKTTNPIKDFLTKRDSWDFLGAIEYLEKSIYMSERLEWFAVISNWSSPLVFYDNKNWVFWITWSTDSIIEFGWKKFDFNKQKFVKKIIKREEKHVLSIPMVDEKGNPMVDEKGNFLKALDFDIEDLISKSEWVASSETKTKKTEEVAVINLKEFSSGDNLVPNITLSMIEVKLEEAPETQNS